MRGMLNQRCTVKRYQTIKDEYNTPIGDDWQTVGTFPCALSRKNIRAHQSAPDNRSEEQYMLYMLANADIQDGDIVEIVGVGKYKASKPYRPNGRHTEVQVEWDGPI